MDAMTNPVTLWARDVARRLRLTKVFGSLMSSNSYEDKFLSGLQSEIKPGNVVWDVGANVGYYTSKYSGMVGANGTVIAFEPSPNNLARLRTATVGLENVRIIDKALGQVVGFVNFTQGLDMLGATSRVVANGDGGGGESRSVRVPISTADAIIAHNEAAIPDVMKIDTEGFELDVLLGMPRLLATPKLRALFVEVHFQLLKQRNMGGAPAQIVQLLKTAGFETKWLDSSHLAATRR